jgi:hypothetical protein
MKISGIVLIVVGIIALAYGGFGYTRQKKVLDIGPIQATERTHEWVPVPPLVGAAAVIGGIALIVAGSRRR